MGVYSDTIGDLAAKENAVQETAAQGPYADTIRLLGDGDKGVARGALIGAMDAKPDDAARALTLAPEVGVPARAIETDLPAFEAQAQLQRNAKLIDNNPVLSGWLAANPEQARVARDDFDGLDAMTKTWRALSSGWSLAFLNNQRGRLGFESQLGADRAAAIGEVETQMQALPELHGGYGFAQSVSGLAGGLLDNFLRAAPVALEVAAVGGAGGAVAGGVGAIPGAIAGFGVGTAVGFKWDMAKVAAGNSYLSLAKIRGANGEEIPEAAKQAAAVMVGVGTYALANVGLHSLQSTAAATRSAWAAAVEEAVTQPTVQRALIKFGGQMGKAGLEGAALTGMMEGVTVAGEELAKQFSQGDFATAFNDAGTRHQIVDRMVGAALEGAALFPVIKLPFGVSSVVADGLRARKAQADMQLFQSLETGAVDSKLRTRNLEGFRDFLQMQANGSPIENIYLPGERVLELYQRMGFEPAEGDALFGFVPDIKAQMEQARATGGDIVVPTADYIARLAGTPVADELRQDIRVRQDGFSLRDAADYYKLLQEFIADQAVSLRTRMEGELQASQGVRDITADMFSKLRAAGYTVDVANQYAALVGARFETRAERMEGAVGTPAELYAKEGIDVKRVLPSSLERVPVDESDMIIEALRKGSKLPSDRQLFGASLVDYVKKAGGIVDTGGELKAMDAPRGVIRKAREGESVADFGADYVGLKAWELGYFPELAERPTPDELREAIREELRGNPRYAGGATDERKAAFKEAVADLQEFIDRQGIDLNKATNAQVKKAIADYQRDGLEAEPSKSFLQRVKETFGGNPDDGTRARVTLTEGKRLVELFKDANLSSFVHETGHIWLDEMVRDAMRADAPEGIRKDMRTIVEWLGVKSAADIGEAQHEQFARAFEAYLLEGKAPSSALAQAFQKFKAWLLRIYADVVALRVPMSDDIRGVFDRLLASDQEIDAVRGRLALNPIFPTAEAAGMTKAEYAAYTAGVAKARASAEQRLLAKTMAEIRRRRTEEWEREAEVMREQVGGEIRSRPDLRAQYWLRTGRLLDDPQAERAPEVLKISREALRDLYGNDEAAALMPKGTYANKGGVHPDDIAELFGYRSGDEMVRALMTLEATRKQAEASTGQKLDGARYLRHIIDLETAARLAERHGDPLADGTIEAEALAAVHGAAQADVMAVELRALARKAGVEAPLRLDDIRNWTRGALADMPLDRGSNQRAFARAEAKAGKEMERALLKGDAAGAFQAKQRQLVAHLMAAQAGEVADARAAGEKLFARYAAKSVFPMVAQEFTDRVHEILKRIGYPTKRGDAELAGGLGGKTLAEFVADKEAAGHDLAVPSFLLDPGWSKAMDNRWSLSPHTQMTVDEFLGVKDAVTSLIFAGRDQKTITVEGQRQAMDAVVEEALQQTDAMRQRPVRAARNPGKGGRGMDAIREDAESGRQALRSADASLLKMETVFDWLDDDNSNGVFNRVVFRRLADAQVAENKLQKEVTAELLKMFNALPKDRVRDMLQRYELRELPDNRTGKASSMLKSEIIALALNVGNHGNLDKLLKGEGWKEDNVRAVLDRHLTKDDWQFVQGIWDLINRLWPDIESMERRVSGVAPEKVEANPVKTKFGEFAGGYYPVIYDPLRSFDVEQRRQRNAAQMFENNYVRAATAKGHTVTRVEDYARPLFLSLDVLPRHMAQVIHDLTHREAVMDADKFLGDKRIRAGVEETLGRDVYKQFRPWLQSIANDMNVDTRGLAFWDRLANKARTTATMVGLGFRFTTMLAQATGYSDVAEVIGARWTASGFKAFWGTPAKMAAAREFVFDRSGEMANRMNQLDRDIKEGLRTLIGDTSATAKVKQFAFYGIGMMDMAVSVPAWLGGYNKALHEGMTEKDAIYYADKVVRNSQGAGAAKDLAAIQRGSEFQKLITVFYSYFSHFYQRQRNLGRDVGEAVRSRAAGDLPMLMARAWWLMAVPPIMGAILTGQGPKEDENWGAWALQKVGLNLFMGVPVARDIAGGIDSGLGYQFTPVARAVKTIGAAAKDVLALVDEDKDVSDRWVKHAIESAGYITGLPTGQAANTTQFLYDVYAGDYDGEGTVDFLKGLIYGPKPKKER